MTNTETADIAGTVAQVKALSDAGSELVRIAVNTSEAAIAVPTIRERLDAMGCKVPLIGDFHFNGTSCCPTIPSARRRSRSTASILAMSAGVRATTRSSR